MRATIHRSRGLGERIITDKRKCIVDRQGKNLRGQKIAEIQPLCPTLSSRLVPHVGQSSLRTYWQLLWMRKGPKQWGGCISSKAGMRTPIAHLCLHLIQQGLKQGDMFAQRQLQPPFRTLTAALSLTVAKRATWLPDERCMTAPTGFEESKLWGAQPGIKPPLG